jgi:acetyltransferase-like isoleucine patch superfamily enzyme
MLIKKLILDIKTYISINYSNPKRYLKSKIDSYIPKGLNISEHITIRKGVTFSDKVNSVGQGTYIGNNTTILNCAKIGNYCSISHDVKIGLDNHELEGLSTSPLISKMKHDKPTIIEHDVLISSNVVILAGVTIGTGSVIGANSFVNSDIPPYSIAVGSPTRIIRYRFDERAISALLKSKWWENSPDEISSNLDTYLKLIEKQ